MSRPLFIRALAAALTLTAVAVAQPPNDPCNSPTAISGPGPHAWSLTGASVEGGNFDVVCNVDVFRDVWFCWTATCDGPITISTCGQTNTDTVVSIYQGCGCPVLPAPGTPPLCCNDDGPTPGCAPGSEVTCNVVCGEQYMIRISDKTLGAIADGTFRIICDTPCGDPGPECAPGECCGGRPRFTGFAGPVSVTTGLDLLPGAPQLQVLDLSNANTAPAGLHWNAGVFAAPHPSWSQANVGNVFGVAIDDAGHIYVAHTSVYGTNYAAGVLAGEFLDSVGVGGAGAIYKVDTASGVATPFVTLPNTSDPSVAAALTLAQSWPGIGNISVECGRNTLFASNFDDGRIYRISLAAGTVLSTYDHATNGVSAGGAPEAGDAPGWAPLGERVWAVEPHNGRLYYSVYSADTFRSVGPNTIWSIGLDTNTGEFLPGTQRQENLGAVNGLCRNPFTDIAFTPSGSMMVAERSMGDPNPAKADTLSWAHESCLLEFICDAATGGWNPSPNTFAAGNVSAPRSAAGGVDIDFRPGQSYNNYATADALIVTGNPPSFAIYGLIGLPATGGGPANSLNKDLDGITTWPPPKTQLGSVEVSCSKCAEIIDQHILCEISPDGGGTTGCYTYTFTLTNNSGVTVQYILIPDANVTPNVIGPFAPTGLLNGQSTTVTVTICNQQPGPFTLPIVLMDTENDQCCTVDHEIELPDCDCYQLLDGPNVTAVGPGTYSVTLKFQPLAYPIGHVFLAYEPCPGGPAYSVQIVPSYFPVSVPQFGSQVLAYTIITNAPAGAELCIRMTTHTADIWICCSEMYRIRVPGSAGVVCAADVDGDLDVDLTDLATLLAHFGESNSERPEGDLDGDGNVSLSDLSILLANFGSNCF